MRAVWLREFGRPDRLVEEQTPDPVPGPGQVLIEVAYANVVFVDTQSRAGTGPFPVRLPTIPGNGVGGVVGAVGSDVDSRLVGTRVVSATGGAGGYAERVAVDAEALVPVPDGLPLDDAVALLADGRTALLLIRAAGPLSGRRVLVEAAAGGVGTLLVQLARAAGATVVGAAGGPDKVARVRDLGVHQAVDYTDPHWTDTVDGVHVVYDGVGGDIARAAFERLEPGGHLFTFGLASGVWADIPADLVAARNITVHRGAQSSPAALRALTADALAEAAAGRLTPVIGQRFPLDRAVDAHAAIEARATVGKTLLTVQSRRPTAT